MFVNFTNHISVSWASNTGISWYSGFSASLTSATATILIGNNDIVIDDLSVLTDFISNTLTVPALAIAQEQGIFIATPITLLQLNELGITDVTPLNLTTFQSTILEGTEYIPIIFFNADPIFYPAINGKPALPAALLADPNIIKILNTKPTLGTTLLADPNITTKYS